MQKFFGAITILVCVFGGYMWAGGKLGAIWQPAEFLIIIGAAVGSLIIGNPPHVLKEMRQQLRATISSPREEYEYYMELMALLNNLLETARSRGFKHLDSHIESPEQSSIFTAHPKVSNDHLSLIHI